MWVTIKKLQVYVGQKKILLPGALFFSSVSTLVGILPYIFIWLITKELFVMHTDISQNQINTYAWWAAISAILSLFFYFIALSLSHLAAFRVERNMRKRAMQKIVNMPLGFFDRHTIGKIRKVIDDNASITHGFMAHQLPDLAGSILMPILSLALIFIIDWRLGLASLMPIIAIMPIMSLMMGEKGQRFMKLYMDSLEDMNTEAVEYVRGIPVVKVFQQTVFSFKSFHKSIIQYRDLVVAYTKLWDKTMPAYTVIIHGFVFFLIPVSVIIIGHSDSYSNVILNLFFFILLTPIFGQSLMKSMYLNQAAGQTKEALERIEELLATETLPIPKNPKMITAHNISFNSVSFSYPNAHEKAIDNISFDIHEGKTFALVGGSGSGKTTIAKLVPRFWDASEGKVSIGGVHVKEIAPSELMNKISFVFQNTKLFKTSLLENINYGNPNASIEEVEKAVDLAQCREIISRLPKGLDTKIGAEGTYLSGGEQQRIVLARAILKNAPIVVLDEATAFTDPENEHLIKRALDVLTKGKTVLMIAHRLTSIKDVDQILVIEKGKIAEQGTHNDLLQNKHIYATMWTEYQKSVEWSIN